MSRTPFSASRPHRGGTFRPQLEALEDRLAPGGLGGMAPPQGPDLAFLAGLPAGHDQARVRTTSPVVAFADASIVLGSSTLTRTDDQVRIHLKSTGLVPGGAYTAWWVVIE